jgi:hypothetical protein
MPWVECNVTRAGPAENGTVYIALRAKNNSFHNWFVAVPAMEREMLATALTAISTGNDVTTSLSATAPYSTINRLYVRS